MRGSSTVPDPCARRADSWSKGAPSPRQGCTLLPGLIDAHVHLTADASPDFAARMSIDSAAVATGKMARNALSTLRAGFTAVRDLGGKAPVNLRVRDALRAGLIRGTSVLSAGHVICARGGHGHFMGKECEGTEAVRLAASRELAAGADLGMFISNGGILTRHTDPGSCELSKAEISAGIERAHAAGAKTAAHALSTKGIADAVAAGVDSIEHGYMLSPDTVEAMLKRGTFLVPTISALARIIAAGRGSRYPRGGRGEGQSRARCGAEQPHHGAHRGCQGCDGNRRRHFLRPPRSERGRATRDGMPEDPVLSPCRPVGATHRSGAPSSGSRRPPELGAADSVVHNR
jgi:hypothetical protein